MRNFGTLCFWFDKDPNRPSNQPKRYPGVYLGEAWDSPCSLIGHYAPDERYSRSGGLRWDVAKCACKDVEVLERIPIKNVNWLRRPDAGDFIISNYRAEQMSINPITPGGRVLINASHVSLPTGSAAGAVDQTVEPGRGPGGSSASRHQLQTGDSDHMYDDMFESGS